MKEGEENTDPISSFPYEVDMGLVSKSSYSPAPLPSRIEKAEIEVMRPGRPDLIAEFDRQMPDEVKRFMKNVVQVQEKPRKVGTVEKYLKKVVNAL